MPRPALALAVCMLLASTGRGQEEPPSFLVLGEEGEPRAGGLAGAFVVLGDDLGAGLVNPSGLAEIPRFLEGTVDFGSFGRQGGGFKELVPSRFGAVFRYCAYTLGFFRSTPYEVRDGEDGLGSRLDAWSFFGSWQPSRRWSIGLSLSEGKFQSDSTLGLPRPPRVETDFSRLDDTALNSIVGLTFHLSTADRVGATFRTREQWAVPATPAKDEPSETLGLLAPARLTLGYARVVNAFDVVTIAPTAQFEWRDYAQGLTRAGGRLGVEVSFPIFGICWSGCGARAQLRAGWAFVPADAVVHRGLLPSSLERTSGGGFGGSVSFDSFVPMRVDVAAREAHGGLDWSLAVLLRYGVSFRDVPRR